MLEDVLAYIHNRFEVGRVPGEFHIVEGSVALPGAQPGQYVWIEGSVFNDGLRQAPLEGLHDETFSGTIWLLAVPPAVVSLAEEIGAWQEKNGEAVDGPYKSESFGGYSYTKAEASDGSAATGWRLHFQDRLNRWRKLA